MIQMKLFTKQKQTHTKQTYRKGGRDNQKFGISRYKLLYIKQINNKIPLYIAQETMFSILQ